MAFVSSAPNSFVTFCWPPNEVFRHQCDATPIKIPFVRPRSKNRNVFMAGCVDLAASIFFFNSERLVQQYHDPCMPKEELFTLAQKMYLPFSPSAFSLHVEQFIRLIPQ